MRYQLRINHHLPFKLGRDAMQDLIGYIKLFIILPVFLQLYFFAVTSKGVEKQKRCQRFGIVYTTIGMCSLIFQQIHLVIGGLILIMLGFKLISHGLDRIDKKTFITQYDDDI